MYVTCPHCQCLIERSEGDAAAEIPCPACGQAFRLERGETAPVLTAAERRNPGPVAIGQSISHYHTLEPLGGGGMGVVYKAQDTRLGRSVALKFLPQEYAQDPQHLERFQREARTASALNHPHICTMYDVDEHEGLPFLVMELIEGQTLRSLAARRPSLPALLHLVGQVAKALAAAHAAGIMHRDIKPENIMVRDDGYAKVLDFGLARRIPIHGTLAQGTAAEVTEPGTVMGTVRYMSPEQARGETASSASDIFALGIVLYELTVGQHPFPADSQVGVLHAIVAQPPLPPTRLNPEIPASLKVCSCACWRKIPACGPAPPRWTRGSTSWPGAARAPKPMRECGPCRTTRSAAKPSWRSCVRASPRRRLAAGCCCAWPASRASARPPWWKSSSTSWPRGIGRAASPAGAVRSAWPAPKLICHFWKHWKAFSAARVARQWPR